MCFVVKFFLFNTKAVRERERSRGVSERETREITRPLSLTLDYILSLLGEKIIYFSHSLLIWLNFWIFMSFSLLVALLAVLDHEDFGFGDTNGGREGRFLGLIICIYKSLSEWFPSSSQVFYNLFHSYNFNFWLYVFEIAM